MNNNHSIAIVLNGLWIGGAEKFAISLANKFAANGFRAYIFLFKEMDSPLLDLIDKRIEIIYIPRNSKFDFILNKKFDAEISKRGIDKVIIIGSLLLFLLRVFSFTRNKSVSYFISLHSTIPSSFKQYLRTLFFLRFAHKTDTVLFICNNQRLFYNRNYYFMPPKFGVIYNGVDVEYFKPDHNEKKTNKREEMQIGPTDKVILLVATIRPEKGHAYAIESLNKLHKNYIGKGNTHLVFVGSGDEKYIDNLKKISASYALQSFIHFEGNQNDVRGYYEIADLFTLTSFRVETFSIAALEAMSYGLPISLTNIGGASEMVFDGINGLLSISKDTNSIAATWATLLDAKMDKMAIREIAVNNFSLEKMFENYRNAVMK